MSVYTISRRQAVARAPGPRAAARPAPLTQLGWAAAQGWGAAFVKNASDDFHEFNTTSILKISTHPPSLQRAEPSACGPYSALALAALARSVPLVWMLWMIFEFYQPIQANQSFFKC